MGLLAKKNLKGLDITLGMLKTFGCGQQCESKGCLFEMGEFSLEFLKFRAFLRDNGFVRAVEKMQPMYKLNSCTMDAPNAYAIDPDGYMYKCISYVGRPELSIGSINDQFDEEAHKSFSPFDSQECEKCVYLPVCKGACLHYTRHHLDNPQCDVWKYITEEYILQEYFAGGE